MFWLGLGFEMKKLTALQERRIIITINEPIIDIAKEFNTSTAMIHQLRLKFCKPKKKMMPIKGKARRNIKGFKKILLNKQTKPLITVINEQPKKNKRFKIKGMKHISTFKWGYWVRQYRDRKVIIGKIFKFSNYTIKANCLKDAEEWRDYNIIKADFSRPLREEPMAANKLQIAGVYKICICRKHQETPYFRAFWSEYGKQKTKYFNINKYGKQEALKMAVACRDEAVQRLNI